MVEETGPRCPWCEATSEPGATRCAACGAALAQREDLGGLVIPGVTAVDPALADLADRPLRITAPATSATSAAAPALVAGLMAGGPLGLMAVGGVAAVAGVEYLGARRPGITAPADLATLGEPGETARQVAERLDAEAAAEGVPGPAAGPDGEAPAAPVPLPPPPPAPWRPDEPGRR